MDYKVVITPDAEEDIDRFIRYLLLEKQNECFHILRTSSDCVGIPG